MNELRRQGAIKHDSDPSVESVVLWLYMYSVYFLLNNYFPTEGTTRLYHDLAVYCFN